MSQRHHRSFSTVRAAFHPVLGGALGLCLSACSGSDASKSEAPGPWNSGAVLERESQSSGDAEVGRRTLLNGSFMSCGIPLKLLDNPLTAPLIETTLGMNGEKNVPGREGRNADLPHHLNAFTTSEGAEVVNTTCLGCHSGKIDGELVIGLGNASADFTAGITNGTMAGSVPTDLLGGLGLTEPEMASLERLLRTARSFGPDTIMRTVGQNPAEAFTGILLSHHDPQTLAWSDEPLREVVVRDASGDPIDEPRLTSDPPPWWRAKKKNALFYNGMARGDHKGTMALATAVCVDNIPEAERVDALLQDMQAYITTIVAPVYSRGIDTALAAQGKELFAANCAGCHGTYAEDATDDASDTYPNLLIPLDVVGTDPAVANMGVVHSPEFVDWYNGSFYGRITRAAPNDPFPGYMPPPLDGIWATAPYLHNGSVPTIELVLNSKARPPLWKRQDLDSTHYDEDALGWPWDAPPYDSQVDAPAAEQKFIYDTSYWSQSNSGHTFGDHLEHSERRAVIEYLKTL